MRGRSLRLARNATSCGFLIDYNKNTDLNFLSQADKAVTRTIISSHGDGVQSLITGIFFFMKKMESAIYN